MECLDWRRRNILAAQVFQMANKKVFQMLLRRCHRHRPDMITISAVTIDIDQKYLQNKEQTIIYLIPV